MSAQRQPPLPYPLPVDHERPETAVLRAADDQLAALFEAHADFLWRVLKRLGIPEADLEDALQEVLLVVARKLPEYEERGSMRAWLFVIARQVGQHSVRAARRRKLREGGHEPTPSGHDPHLALERSEAARFVETFLAGLSEPQAAVFFLAEIEGLRAPDIAACLGIPLNTVYSRLRLARERFERALDERGHGVPP